MRIFVNLPWSIVGILLAISCLPRKITFTRGIVMVEVFWIWFVNKKYRAVTWHRVILYKPGGDSSLPHELIHVEQYERYLGLFPIIYLLNARHGYNNNRFEQEARSRTKSNKGGLKNEESGK